MAERIADNINLERVVWFLTAISPTSGGSVPVVPGINNAILQEDGFFILQEDGAFILQES